MAEVIYFLYITVGEGNETDVMISTNTHIEGIWIADTKDGVVYFLDEVVNESWLTFRSVRGGKMIQLDHHNLSKGIDVGVFKLVGRG